MMAVRDPVNLGNPMEMTILEFPQAVRAAAGSTAPIVFQPYTAYSARASRGHGAGVVTSAGQTDKDGYASLCGA